MSKRYDFTEVHFSDPEFYDRGESDVLYRGNRLGAFWYWLTLPSEARLYATRERVRAVSL